jgi:hypothetical protein
MEENEMNHRVFIVALLVSISISCGCQRYGSGAQAPRLRPLTENENKIVAELRASSGDQQQVALGPNVNIGFQPDPLSSSGDCWVTSMRDHSRWNLTYQRLSGGREEGIMTVNRVEEGQPVRMKGDSSDHIFNLAIRFGDESVGLPATAPDFRERVDMLTSAHSVKVDSGAFRGHPSVATYDLTGFESGYRLAQDLCK